MTLREQEALKEIEKVSDMWREREKERKWSGGNSELGGFNNT